MARKSTSGILVSTGIFPNRKDPTRGVYVGRQVVALSHRAPLEVVAPVRFVPGWMARGKYRTFAGVPSRDKWEEVPVRYPRYVVIPRVARALHGFGVFVWSLAAHSAARRRLRPAVVLSYFAYPYGFAAVLTALCFRLPVIVSCRGSDINHLAKPWLHRRLISWALRRCARVLAVSDALSREVEALGVQPERIRVVSNGIDAKMFREVSRREARDELGIESGAEVVVCVSRLSPEKGIDVLLDAATILRSVRPKLRVIIVGDGTSRAELEKMQAERELGQVVVFAGRRPHEEVSVWLNATNVAVLPSRSEGYPNVLLEALACGRPAVASRVGGVPEIIEDGENGYTVPPCDAGALATAIGLALDREWDPASLRRRTARSWDQVAGDILQVVDEVRGVQ